MQEQKNRLKALAELVRDYALWAAPLETTVKSGEDVPASWWQTKRNLQERARKLLRENEIELLGDNRLDKP